MHGVERCSTQGMFGTVKANLAGRYGQGKVQLGDGDEGLDGGDQMSEERAGPSSACRSMSRVA